MRMWMINPKLMCDKHLLGEHGEIHKNRHNFVKKHKVTGRIIPFVQIEPQSMLSRHDELAVEMVSRGMNHKSLYEMPSISHLPLNEQIAKANIQRNVVDLANRCKSCAALINEAIL